MLWCHTNDRIHASSNSANRSRARGVYVQLLHAAGQLRRVMRVSDVPARGRELASSRASEAAQASALNQLCDSSLSCSAAQQLKQHPIVMCAGWS